MCKYYHHLTSSKCLKYTISFQRMVSNKFFKCENAWQKFILSSKPKLRMCLTCHSSTAVAMLRDQKELTPPI